MITLNAIINDKGELTINRNISGTVTAEHAGKFTQALNLTLQQINNDILILHLQANINITNYYISFYAGVSAFMEEQLRNFQQALSQQAIQPTNQQLQQNQQASNSPQTDETPYLRIPLCKKDA